MTPIKSLFITLSLLAMLAVNAAAQAANCPKSYWIQLPSGWNSSFYVKIDNVQSVSLTPQSGGWYSFTLSQNDLQYKTFHFQNENRDANEVRKIGTTKWAETGDASSVGQFRCSTLGGNVDRVYIYPNPSNPSQTMYGSNPPNARYFYFLPPIDYITYSPYLWNDDKPKRMSIDADRCGWYKMVFFGSTVVPDADGLILFSPAKPNDAAQDLSDSRQVLGLYGMDETEWVDGIPTPINLKHMFDSLLGDNQPGSIFFVSEGSYDRWSKIDPMIDELERCSYNLAAVIYYKGQTGNSFSHYADQGGDAEGVCKGYVQPRLKDGKMQWNNKNGGCGNYGWANGTDFENAFKKTPGQNQQLCYDMPFQRRTGGLWEFDALYLCRDGSLDFTGNCRSGRVGGFYLPDAVFQSAGVQKVRTYGGDFGVGPQACFNKWCYDRGWIGGTCNGINSSNMGEGSLDGLTTKAQLDAKMREHCQRPVDNYDFAGYGDWLGTMPGGSSPAGVTGLLCFESHANFTYEKGQEFFFRGDDDIWVFINNQLVIDLGGNHGPAPGYVKLDTISVPERLEEFKDYPIDIFFCDRRGPGANVRISTDMYIKSKNLLYTEPDRGSGQSTICAIIDEGGAGCAGALGGGGTQTMCGSNFTNGYSVVFYAVNAKDVKDTVWLKSGASRCSGSSEKNFTCYDGIKVNNAVYSCGGKTKCQKDQAATEMVKNWPNTRDEYIIYVGLTKNGQRVAGRNIEIDRITPVPEEIKMVWGTLTNIDPPNNKVELKDSYKNNTTGRQEIIAGRRTPIYVASGSWSNGAFTYVSDAEGSYSIANVNNLKNNGLMIYKGETGNTEKWNGSLSKGIDTLWVEGTYGIGTKDFELNTEAGLKKREPSLVLTVYQPELRFMEEDFKTRVANPDGYQWFGYNEPPYVTSPLDIYIAAWDPRKNVFCDHCNFVLDQTSSTNNDSLNRVGGEGIVLSDKLQMKDGKLTTTIAGYYQVLNPSKASWTVYYRELEYGISAQWTNLEFKDAPVPMPMNSSIYDRNGDGIGDSLRVEFNKSFRGDTGAIRDSALLVLLEVIWEKGGDTIRYHHRDYSPDSLKKRTYVEELYKKPEFFAKNLEYWKDRVEGDKVIVLKDKMFSNNILTYAYFNDKTDKSKIVSYTPFNDDDIFTYSEVGYSRDILDSIPPVVVKAAYAADKDAGCMGTSKGCDEKLEVQLSEPVFASYVDSVAIINPFSYCFRSQQLTLDGNASNCPDMVEDEDRHSQDWNNIGLNGNKKWDWELPGVNKEDAASYTYYDPNHKTTRSTMTIYLSGGKGDSIVRVVYRAKKNGDGTTTRMPKGADWIKIRESGSVFMDAAGNSFNPREVGVLITGKNYYTKNPIKVVEINPNEKSPVRDMFDPNGQTDRPWWMTDNTEPWADSMFKDDYGRVTEFLPIPKGISVSDTAKWYYPGTVGTIFGVADNIRDRVGDLRNKDGCTLINEKGEDSGIKCSDGSDDDIARGISMYAKVYYHTNLGDYTAHRDPVVAECASGIFKDKLENGTCLSNQYNFYLAWDLKTNGGRFVGTGAYVAITKFYWQLKYYINGSLKKDKFNEDEFIDIFGVRRTGKSYRK